MMYSITEAIYETYSTAAFLRVPSHDRYRAAPARFESGRGRPRQRPIGGLLTRARRTTGRALTGLAAALQAGGDRLLEAERA